MKLKPVLEKNSKRFIWEISDVEIPEILTNLIETREFVSYNSDTGEGSLKHQETRYKLLDKDYKVNEILNSIVQPAIVSILSSSDYILDSVWPPFFIDDLRKNIPFFGGEVVKDLPGHKMSNHLDNNLMFASCILNLKDNNNCVTEYYKDSTGKQVIYRSKSENNKGVGTIHLNSPYLYHNGFNRSNEERIVAFCNICLK